MKFIFLILLLFNSLFCLAQKHVYISLGLGVSNIHRPLLLVGNNQYSNPEKISTDIGISKIFPLPHSNSVELGISYSNLNIQDKYISRDNNSSQRIERISTYDLYVKYVNAFVLYGFQKNSFTLAQGLQFSRLTTGQEHFNKVLYYIDEIIPESDIKTNEIDGINNYNMSYLMQLQYNFSSDFQLCLAYDIGLLNLIQGESKVVPIVLNHARRMNTMSLRFKYKI